MEMETRLGKDFRPSSKAAVKGDYKLRQSLKASPYDAGTTEERTLEGLGLKKVAKFDMAKALYQKPDRKSSQEVSTEEVATTKPKLVLCQSMKVLMIILIMIMKT